MTSKFKTVSKKFIPHCSLLIPLLFSSFSTFAVNGAFDFGFSEITRGMAGAGSALPQDTLIAAVNPAGMVDVGRRFDLGAVLYFPTMSYNATPVISANVSAIAVAPGKHESDVPLFFLPDAGINFPLDEKSSFGISLYSLGGFGSKYKTNDSAYINTHSLAGVIPSAGPVGGGTLLSDLKQAVTSLTYSRKFLKRSSFGLSVLLGLQELEVRGLSNLAILSVDSNHLSNKGSSYSAGIGARLGFLFGLLPNLNLGISYQPQMAMTKFREYSGLLPNGGEFNIPAYGNIGLAWHIFTNIALAADVEKIWYKDVPAYGRSHNASLTGACTNGNSNCLGGKNGGGFGWNNDVIYKFGAQWEMTPTTTLRAGFNHSDQVLSNTYAMENMVTPGALIRDLYTIGATQKISKNDFINGIFVFIPKQSLNSLNPFSGPANQYVKLSAEGFGFGVSWSRVLE